MQKGKKKQDAVFDVFALGNALLDLTVFVEQELPEKLGFKAGTMTLSDSVQHQKVLDAIQKYQPQLRCGGSAANTLWALMQSGGMGCFLGKVSNDSYGNFYRREMEENKIHFPCPPQNYSEKIATGSCAVLTTPDAQRTMNTHLGAASLLHEDDLGLDLLKKSRIVYCEGYLWGGPETRKAGMMALKAAKKENIQTAFSFSDPELVKNLKKDFQELISDGYCDMIFCNLDEAKALCDTDSKQVAINFLKGKAKTIWITEGSKGCTICSDSQIEESPSFPVRAIDTNGAGDGFAGGVLFALSRNYGLSEAARWGNYLGSLIASSSGARLNRNCEKDLEKICSIAPTVAPSI